MPPGDAPVVMIPKSAPGIGNSNITPSVINAWEHGCLQFFRDRNISDHDKVFKACMYITHDIIRDWYRTDNCRFDGMDFDEFLAELRANHLPSNWDVDIKTQIMNARQRENQTFAEFVLGLEVLNTQLRASPSRFSLDGLRLVIETRVCDSLRPLIQSDEIQAIPLEQYVRWKSACNRADDQRRRQVDVIMQILTANQPPGSRRGNTTVTGPSSKVSLPQLTVAERQILTANKGCFKCRRLNVVTSTHMSGTCPNGAPDGATYVPLTTKYPHLVAQGQGSKENVRPKRTIASVNEDTDMADATTVASVAAVGLSPLAQTTGILGTGSDSDESCVPPLFAPQTFLRARLTPDPDAPIFDMLIDGGAGPVLVRRDVAESMGVPLRRLPTAHRLGNAWGKASEGVRSEEWVKLKVLLPDFSWSSRVSRAIVVDNLCAPVILGKAWLEINSIIEDHAAHQLLDKLGL
ncbi:hypothetical protein BD310DRAFT_979445 [Dichomitus squalens]|uniref:Retrotransposon gag domain-containing protein n=1 Tax=Dichomitus squalens TaxID=114155 RepID=A0A4Q9PNI5_9APHY|nr:hypothetical protein BD310DRAFT_979445 [Dichomitus squalens]